MNFFSEVTEKPVFAKLCFHLDIYVLKFQRLFYIDNEELPSTDQGLNCHLLPSVPDF